MEKGLKRAKFEFKAEALFIYLHYLLLLLSPCLFFFPLFAVPVWLFRDKAHERSLQI